LTLMPSNCPVRETWEWGGALAVVLARMRARLVEAHEASASGAVVAAAATPGAASDDFDHTVDLPALWRSIVAEEKEAIRQLTNEPISSSAHQPPIRRTQAHQPYIQASLHNTALLTIVKKTVVSRLMAYLYTRCTQGPSEHGIGLERVSARHAQCVIDSHPDPGILWGLTGVCVCVCARVCVCVCVCSV